MTEVCTRCSRCAAEVPEVCRARGVAEVSQVCRDRGVDEMSQDRGVVDVSEVYRDRGGPRSLRCVVTQVW